MRTVVLLCAGTDSAQKGSSDVMLLRSSILEGTALGPLEKKRHACCLPKSDHD